MANRKHLYHVFCWFVGVEKKDGDQESASLVDGADVKLLTVGKGIAATRAEGDGVGGELP
jgi:hypothetical protein